MKKNIWLIPISLIVLIAVLWFSGMIPKQIARLVGTHYVKEHFPRMQLECVDVEWADVFGDYLISFRDKDGNIYSCQIGPALFPTSLGQGLFAIQDYYAENYGKSNGHDTSPTPADTVPDEAFDIAVSYAGWSENLFLGGLNAEKMSISSVQHLPIYKFDTLNDVNQFKLFRNGFSFDGSYDEMPSFNDTTAKYDEAFFAENTLMLVYVPSNSGTYRYGVNSVYCDGNSFCVHVEQTNNPEQVTCDMAGWFVTVAVPDSVIENCTEFDADLNNLEK